MRGRTTGPDASACGNKRLVIWISLAIRKKETTDLYLRRTLAIEDQKMVLIGDTVNKYEKTSAKIFLH